MFRAIKRNKRNTLVVIAFFLLIVAAVSGYIGYETQNLWIPTIVLSFVAIYTLVQYFLAAREAISLVGGYEVNRNQEPMLWNLVENLAIREGIPMPRVFVIPDDSPNALAAGTSPKKALVGVTTGLMRLMNKSELEAVLAHEIGHIKNYDIRVKTVIFGLVGAVAAIAVIGWGIFFAGLQASSQASRGRDKNAGGLAMIFAFFGLAIGVIGSTVAHVIGPVLRSAVSKQREYLADASAVESTRFPDALISALEKLRDYGSPMSSRSSSTAHLYFSSPLKNKLTQALVGTHPSLDRRIERLKRIGTSLR